MMASSASVKSSSKPGKTQVERREGSLGSGGVPPSVDAGKGSTTFSFALPRVRIPDRGGGGVLRRLCFLGGPSPLTPEVSPASGLRERVLVEPDSGATGGFVTLLGSERTEGSRGGGVKELPSWGLAWWLGFEPGPDDFDSAWGTEGGPTRD